MHLSDENIQRLLHGELDPEAKEPLLRHVTGCRRCAALLEEAEREEQTILDLLRHVDHPVAPVDVESITRVGRARAAVWGRRVAGVLIAAALAGAAYAVPGSPVPRLLHRVTDWFTGAPPRYAEERTPDEPVTSGIVVPVNERLEIFFTDVQTEGVAEVSLGSEPDVVVRVIGGSATFTTDAARLTIGNQGSTARYEIELPRDAPWIAIHVGPRRVMLKDGNRIVTDAPLDSSDRYRLPLGPPGAPRE